jgi:hypothetical protein
LKNGEKHDTELVMAEVDVVGSPVDEARVKGKRNPNSKRKDVSVYNKFQKHMKLI